VGLLRPASNRIASVPGCVAIRNLNSNRANLRGEQPRCAAQQHRSAGKYPRPAGSTTLPRAHPPRVSASQPAAFHRSPVHPPRCRSAQALHSSSKAKTQPPTCCRRPAPQTPSTPPNPQQNIAPPAIRPAAQTESAHRAHATSPPRKSRHTPRTNTPPAPRDSDRPKIPSRRHAEARRRVHHRSRRRPKTLPSTLSIVGENP